MENEYIGPERRRFRRVRMNVMVIYKTQEPLTVHMMVGDKEVPARMLDLSEAGMAIATDYNIPNETILLIEFILINVDAIEKKTRRINIIGEVRNNTLIETKGHQNYRLGIYFTQISDEDRIVIANFIKTTTGYK